VDIASGAPTGDDACPADRVPVASGNSDIFGWSYPDPTP
jgi:hypothetical protein